MMPLAASCKMLSLSARRAWIEMQTEQPSSSRGRVALRKESVDRNYWRRGIGLHRHVALRKESVDRNLHTRQNHPMSSWSLSARRAWIEIVIVQLIQSRSAVALRKESVDRNPIVPLWNINRQRSLSARRAWIEMAVMRAAVL